jgi:hypothetical protein
MTGARPAYVALVVGEPGVRDEPLLRRENTSSRQVSKTVIYRNLPPLRHRE